MFCDSSKRRRHNLAKPLENQMPQTGKVNLQVRDVGRTNIGVMEGRSSIIFVMEDHQDQRSGERENDNQGTAGPGSFSSLFPPVFEV